MAHKVDLDLLYGGGDMIVVLEDLLEKVREGVVVGIVVGAARADEGIGWTAAWKEGQTLMWSRLLAVAASLYDDLLRNGLPD